MDFNMLDEQLRNTFADHQLSNSERDELRALGSILDPDRIRFLRNRAFAMVREMIQAEPQNSGKALQALKWLEQVIKTFDSCSEQAHIEASAHFSPGDSCRNKIMMLCKNARHSIDVCVFTISDNQLSDELIAAGKRGVGVRIITDDDKQHDSGSDIQLLKEANIPLRTDNNEYHMHHKFAVFDRKILLNGSFNWTRSASTSNAENLLTTDNPTLVVQYLAQFDKLWQRYG